MNICGDDGIYIPSTECDDCAVFITRLERAEEDIDALERDKQDKMQAGDGIEFDGATINATINPSNTYTKTEVNTLLSDLDHIKMQIVDTLPATGETNVIYLLEQPGGGYEQWVYTEEDGWIDLGSEDIDLSDYYTKAQVDALIATQQDKITAGQDLEFSGNTLNHVTSGVVAGAKGESADKTIDVDDKTFKTLHATVNSRGHVTELHERTITLDLLDWVWPVGSYYETSDTAFDPNTSWGGTWELEAAGKVHVGAGTGYAAGSTGGSETKSYTPQGSNAAVTLTAAQSGVPAHAHSMQKHTHEILHAHQPSGSTAATPRYFVVTTDTTTVSTQVATGSSGRYAPTFSATGKYARAGWTANPASDAQDTGEPSTANTANNTAANATASHNHTFTGTAANINVMQPYVAVNRWHRTA